MAKLNVVIPAADVEVIGEGGVKTKYRKVDRDAKRGDIIKITDNDDSSYVIEDAFYTVEYLDGADDPQILDEDGDEYDAGHMEYEVYEKVAESAVALDPRNKFAIGDKVRIVSGAGERYLLGYKNGDIVEIRSGADKDGDYSLSSPRDGVTPGNAKPEQLEKVSAEEIAEIERKALIAQFSVGDTVKLTVPEGNYPRFGWGSVKSGDIGKIVRVFDDRLYVDFPNHSGWSADPTELTKVSAEDIAKQLEESKWAAIGRKVNEFKRGDVVKCVGPAGDEAGVGVVLEEREKQREYLVKYYSWFGECTEPVDIIEMIVPVEQRFDREEAA